MAALKRSGTIKDYTSFVDNLKSDLAKLQEDMKLQIYNQYPAFVEAFSELHSFVPPQTKPYELCLDSLQALYDEIQGIHPGEEAVQKPVDKAQDWEERVEELEASISEERFQEACTMIEDAGKLDSTVDAPKARLNFDIQSLRLVDAVSAHLADPRCADAKMYVTVLRRLNAMRQAKEAFFVGRSRLLRTHLQRIGAKDAKERCVEIAKVFFTLVRDTLQESEELLSDTTGVFFWSQRELKYISSLVGDCLFLLDDTPTLLAALTDMHSYSALLESEGLSLTTEFDSCLGPYLHQFFGEYVAVLKTAIDGKVRGEIWKQQVVQLHLESEVQIIRLSSTCASLHRDIVALFDTCAQLLPANPLLACDLVPKVLSLVQGLILAYLNCKVLAGKKKMSQLVVVLCDFWNLCGVVKEAQWKLEMLFDPGKGALFETSDILSAIKARFRSEITEFFVPLYTERAKTYLSALEPLVEPFAASNFPDSKCEELLSVLKELHSTLSSSTDRSLEACSLLLETLTSIWSEKLDTLLFESYGYWSLDSKQYQ